MVTTIATTGEEAREGVVADSSSSSMVEDDNVNNEKNNSNDNENHRVLLPAHVSSSSSSSSSKKRSRGRGGAVSAPKEDEEDIITRSSAAVVIEEDYEEEEDDDDIDEDECEFEEEEEEDDDDFDPYDYDPCSGSDHALPDPPASILPPEDSGSASTSLTGANHVSSSSGGVTTSSIESSLPWRPQNQQSTCEFTHTITNYSQKRESGCKKAEYSATTVDTYGNRWRLIIYVNGNGRASNHHLSLFLQVRTNGWKGDLNSFIQMKD